MSSYRSRRWRWVRRLADAFDVYVFPKDVVGKYGEVNWGKHGAGDRYVKVQKAASQAKYNLSWAKKENCAKIVHILEASGERVRSMICHGVRNGSELGFFREAGVPELMGTDLYVPTGSEAHIDVVEHDFSKPEPKWVEMFQYVYSNSLDHSLDPISTLLVWSEQIEASGSILLELDVTHGVGGTSDLDVTGIPLDVLPFWLSRETNNKLFVKAIYDLPRERFLYQICKAGSK